jgi:hypothetical protein
MTGFEAYLIYLGLKLHFNSEKFNFFTNKSRASRVSFNRRGDRMKFESLAKKKDLKGILLANFVEDHTYYLGSEVTETVYLDWKRRNQSLTYVFQNDLNCLDADFLTNLKVYDGQHPKILRLFLGRKICIETLCIIASLFKAVPYWDKHLEQDPLWQEIRMKLLKYPAFFKFDVEKYKKILLDKFDT